MLTLSMGERIFLIFHGRFPGEKAASLFAAYSAWSFAGAGAHVTLIVPRRRGVSQDPYAYYDLPKTFEVHYVATLDLFGLVPNFLAFYISLAVFSISSFWYLWRAAGKGDIIYSNETLPLLLATYRYPRTVYELHDFPEGKLFFYRTLLRRAARIVATNEWKAHELEKLGVSAQKVLTEPNAVDLKRFHLSLSKEQARAEVGLPAGQKVALYTGHLYGWKGVDTLAEAAKQIPEITLVFVGGTLQDQVQFKEKYGSRDTIRLVAHQPHARMPLWQRAADVLVLPNTGHGLQSREYTSPMKLFEYMASGTPVVASDLPSIRAVAGDTATYAKADDPAALAQALRAAVAGSPEIEHKATQALQKVGGHTWELRAQRIIDFLHARK